MFKNKKHLLGLMRSAVERYNMIEAGDSIAVGVSGGKDSLALLCLLGELQKFYPKRFSLTAVTIDPGFGGQPADYSGTQALCRQMETSYVISQKNFGEILFEPQNGIRNKNSRHPCSLCAKLRRGCLHNLAIELGCNKLALGHHRDDAAETFLMNLLRGGRASCFAPVTHMDRKGIYVIRPLIFASEGEVAAFAQNNRLPIVKSACPVDGATERARIKSLIAELSKDYDALPQKLVGALQKGGINGW